MKKKEKERENSLNGMVRFLIREFFSFFLFKGRNINEKRKKINENAKKDKRKERKVSVWYEVLFSLFVFLYKWMNFSFQGKKLKERDEMNLEKRYRLRDEIGNIKYKNMIKKRVRERKGGIYKWMNELWVCDGVWV